MSYSRVISFLSDSTTSYKQALRAIAMAINHTHFDDDNQRRLKERGVRRGIQDGCTRLKRLEKAAYISTECEIVSEKDLLL